MHPRPGTTARGYGAAHKKARKAGLPAAYGKTCSRYGQDPKCPGVMRPGQRLELDHTDDRQGYRGFSHAACNARASSRHRKAG